MVSFRRKPVDSTTERCSIGSGMVLPPATWDLGAWTGGRGVGGGGAGAGFGGVVQERRKCGRDADAKSTGGRGQV